MTEQVKGGRGVPLLIFLITSVGTLLMGVFMGKSDEELIRLTVTAAIGAGTLNFILAQSRLEGTLLYDNQDHLWRFFFFYTVSLLLAFVFVFLPVAVWPFMVISVALCLFGNEITGMASTALLLMLTVSLSEARPGIFLLYFMTGMAAAAVFRRLDESFQVFYPSMISVLILIVGQTAYIVLAVNEQLNPEMFIISTIGLFLNIMFLVIVLRYLNFAVVNRYRMLYMEINDQEFSLLAGLKQSDRQAYYLAIHTAYFCERIAVAVGLDARVCKAGGYYHRLENFSEEPDEDFLETLEQEYRFPPAVIRLLREYRSGQPLVTKETSVVYLSDAVVSCMMELFKEDSSASVDYAEIIVSLFAQLGEEGILNACELTIAEYGSIQKIFLEEKLYYDFLR